MPASFAMLSMAAAVPLDLPLNQWPMIEAHDSATGYLPIGPLHVVNAWAVTQPSDTQTAITTQLNCGTRAFDWRPKVNNKGDLVMHHGAVEVGHAMADAAKEMVEWAAANSADEDLILLAVTDCEGADCYAKAQAVLTDAGVPTHIVDCSALQGMTLGKALELSKLPGGGHLLPIYDCVDGNYHPEVTCSGYTNQDKSEFYTCYTDSKHKDFPVQRMFDHLDKVSQAGAPSTGRAWSMQALWQESADSVVIGTLHGSSLLKDEERSQLNSQITAAVKSGRFPNINLLEVNNVCDGGSELLAALRARVTSEVVV